MKVLRKLRSILPILLTATLSGSVLAQSAEVKRAIEQLHDIDPAVRLQAIYTISGYASEFKYTVDPVLETLSNDPDPEVKKAAIAVLGELAKKSSNPQPIIAKLRSLLASEDQTLALIAVVTLEEFPNDPNFKGEAEKRFSLIQQGLKSSEPTIVELAVSALGTSKDARAEKSLIALLQNPEQRRSAAATLASSSTEASRTALLDFSRQALKSDNAEEQELALAIVGVVSGADVELENEIAQLAGQDTPNGANALSYYYRLKPELALPLMKKALNSSNVEVRRAAIYTASSLKRPEFRSLSDDLAALMKKSTEEEELQLLLQLVSIQEPIESKFFESVIALASSESSAIRTTVVDALTRFGVESKRAIPVLTKLLNDKEPEIQIKSAVGLYLMTGDYAMVQKTVEALAQDPEVVTLALSYTSNVDGTPLQRRFVEALKTHALAGKSGALGNLAYQSIELDPQLIKLYGSKFDSLDASQRATIVSRMSYLHPARDGVVPFLKRCLDSGGEERWSAAPVYLRFTADSVPVAALIRSAFASGNSTDLINAMSTLTGDDQLSRQFANELASVALGNAESHVRQYAFGVLASADRSRAADTAITLVRQGEFGITGYSDQALYEELYKRMTPADREKIVASFLDLVKEPQSWYERETELTSYLSMFGSISGWPASLTAGLTDIEKKHPSPYIRDYAVKAREKQVKS